MNRTEEAKRKVRDAAGDLLHEAGVPAFTVDAVSRRSGVAKTTIYRHWPNGNALLIDTLACQIEALPTPNTGSLRTDLRTLFAMLIPVTDRVEKSRMMFGLLYAAADDPDLRRALTDLIRERTGPIRTIVELAQARGELPASLDLDHAVDLVEGPFLYRFMFRGEPYDPDDFDVLLDHVVRGLGG
jgi:AcrR family transcriptional regulator